MKRWAVWAVGAMVLMLVAGATEVFAQGTFKIPFEFEAGSTKLRAGEYRVAAKGEGDITLRQEATGKEFQVPFTKRLAQPKSASRRAPACLRRGGELRAVVYGIRDGLRAGGSVVAGWGWISGAYHEGRTQDPDHQGAESKIADGTRSNGYLLKGEVLHPGEVGIANRRHAMFPADSVICISLSLPRAPAA